MRHKIVLEIEDMENPSAEKGNVSIKFEITPEVTDASQRAPSIVLFHKVMAALRETQVSGPGTPTKKERSRAKFKTLLGKGKRK